MNLANVICMWGMMGKFIWNNMNETFQQLVNFHWKENPIDDVNGASCWELRTKNNIVIALIEQIMRYKKIRGYNVHFIWRNEEHTHRSLTSTQFLTLEEAKKFLKESI